MTSLCNTGLSLQEKVELSAKALAANGNYGEVTKLRYQFNISRTTIYTLQSSINEILTKHFKYKEYDSVNIIVDERQIERAIISLRTIAPNSIRAIEELLPILYPGIKISYGKIQSILVKSGEKAKLFNKSVNLSNIKNSALDEMFSQGNPVLAGIDLTSGYLHSLELKDSRNGTDWADVLNLAKAQGMNLDIVVKDAAKGIASGVTAVYPDAEQRDDCFHVLYDTNKLKRRLRGAAYSAIEAEYKAKQALDKAKQTQNLKKINEMTDIYNKESENSIRRIDRFDSFNKAAKLITEAMEYVDIKTGKLYAGQDIEKIMMNAGTLLKSIEYLDCKKLGTYILNRSKGIALATESLNCKLKDLNPKYSFNDLSQACKIIRLIISLKKNNQPKYILKNYIKSLFELHEQLEKSIGKKMKTLISDINSLLEKRYRASSAIEGFNSFLRPYLYTQKGVTQNFLGLLNAYYNLRTRRWGRHKGTSAIEKISGTKVKDWLTNLGYPPLSCSN